MSTVAFLHAHPDDEAIFTGGTMVRLSQMGHRVILVLATGGELGAQETGASRGLATIRMEEADRSAELLGIDKLLRLGFLDSGMSGDPANHAPGSFWSAEPGLATDRLAELLDGEEVDSLVTYDPHGVYGHPDHIQCHRIGTRAAEMAAIASVYEMTVDREYLHFVETHLVTEAALSGDLGLAGSSVGYSSVEIDLMVDVRSALAQKRQAMAAHTSQLPEEAPVFLLDEQRFGEVYGWEWYVRRGVAGALEDLA